MKKSTRITIAVILVLSFFVPGAYGLKISVSSESGGSTSSFNDDYNLANEASLDGRISIDESGVHPNVKITKPTKKVKGLDNGEWGAKWWQWAFSMPVDANPLFDTAEISQGQSGNVWFIGSKVVNNPNPDGEYVAVAQRDGTIPPGTRLFFPVMNVEGSTLEGNGATEKDLQDYAAWVMEHVSDMSAEIDGRPVNNLEDYLAPSGQFNLGPLPDNNYLQYFGVDAPKGTITPSASNGIYLMLEPLSVGKHTIDFKGTTKFTEDLDGFNFVFKQDTSYDITVAPK